MRIVDEIGKYRALYDAIVSDPRYLRNIEYGKPRDGHPEGTVRDHIAELESNLIVLLPLLSTAEYFKLLCLIHVHDSFKAESKRDCPIADSRSHASIAAAFLKHLGGDDDLVAMCQWHDENYALWKQHAAKGKYSQWRMDRLMYSIQDWSVFSAFIIIDGCTTGKSLNKLVWFFEQIEGRVKSRFGKEHIIIQVKMA